MCFCYFDVKQFIVVIVIILVGDVITFLTSYLS